MKKIFAFLLFSFITQYLLAQSISDIDKDFTGDDLYKWRHQMNFKPKYMEVNAFDNMLLKLNWQVCRQFKIESRVMWEGLQRGQDSRYFVFKTQMKEYYGEIAEEKVKNWIVPYFVFLEIDKWAKGYINNNKK
jgi:uncharacterized protein involved in tolerance to divalent cations